VSATCVGADFPWDGSLFRQSEIERRGAVLKLEPATPPMVVVLLNQLPGFFVAWKFMRAWRNGTGKGVHKDSNYFLDFPNSLIEHILVDETGVV
jgi:hypothetical protein